MALAVECDDVMSVLSAVLTVVGDEVVSVVSPDCRPDWAH